MVRFTQAYFDVSSSVVFADTRGYAHFKWDCIKKFLYLGFTVASSSTNFDIFSNICQETRIFDFIICVIFLGMPYMIMDIFIKQYTRSLDFNSNLNPLLKAISIGLLLQTAMWAIVHASDLADSIRYLFSFLTSLKTDADWARCNKQAVNSSCMSPKEILKRCRTGIISNFNHTSSHLHYQKSFTHMDKNCITIKFFASALVWIFNFFFATVTTETLLKICKFSFMWRLFSTIVIVIVTLMVKKQYAGPAIAQIFNATSPTSFANAMDHVSCVFGIGVIGVYDFGTMSPYTMVDNAVLIFTVVFTLSAFVRSLIVKMLYLVLTKCVEVEISITPHYLLFAVLPMSSEFLYGHKLYIIYFYVNLMLAANAYLAMLTLTMSQLLHSEFRSVKNMYIVGLLCFLGFSLSVPVGLQSVYSNSRHQGLIYGLKVTVLYLGVFRVAIIMWVYGIQRFSTDVHFWLGFKPAKFWRTCWMFLPVALLVFFVQHIYFVINMTDFPKQLTAAIWIGFTGFIVAVFHIRTLGQYLLRNDFARAFLSNSKYGPPDFNDRKKRLIFNETIESRRCSHKCNVIDETYECNHLPLTQRSKTVLDSASSGSSDSEEPDVKDPVSRSKFRMKQISTNLL